MSKRSNAGEDGREMKRGRTGKPAANVPAPLAALPPAAPQAPPQNKVSNYNTGIFFVVHYELGRKKSSVRHDMI